MERAADAASSDPPCEDQACGSEEQARGPGAPGEDAAKKAELCRVCLVQEAKYKCPLCRERTCSVPCYKRHLQEPAHLRRTRSADPFLCHVEGEAASAQPTKGPAPAAARAEERESLEAKAAAKGEAPPLGSRVSLRVEFVRMRDFGDEQLRQDVKLLEGASKALEAAQRQRLEGPSDACRRKRGANPLQLRALCQRRGTDFVFLPPSHSRRTTNKTRLLALSGERRRRAEGAADSSALTRTLTEEPDASAEPRAPLGSSADNGGPGASESTAGKGGKEKAAGTEGGEEKAEKEEAALAEGPQATETASLLLTREPKIAWQVGVEFPAASRLRVLLRVLEDESIGAFLETLRGLCSSGKAFAGRGGRARPSVASAEDRSSPYPFSTNAPAEALRKFFEETAAAGEKALSSRAPEEDWRALLPLPRGKCFTTAPEAETPAGEGGARQRAYLLPGELTLRECLQGTTVVEVRRRNLAFSFRARGRGVAGLNSAGSRSRLSSGALRSSQHPELLVVLPRELEGYTCWEPPIRGGPPSRLIPKTGMDQQTPCRQPEQAESSAEPKTGKRAAAPVPPPPPPPDADWRTNDFAQFKSHSAAPQFFSNSNAEAAEAGGKHFHQNRFGRKRRGKPWGRGGGGPGLRPLGDNKRRWPVTTTQSQEA